ncbi:branched-chain amino acid ABC transporter permease [Bordetella genomosp. 10]|uniref:Branched-chain amino acid ABC transporter permease n=1 Tax=Bordetella genomosp. 10 TaxID=1416804 RepID=A0A261S9Z2_9BORD|nr:DUF3100 domain-containing protein [Bordetella genomosp. 10]OZI34209.1 branched-chain amino acid ABC transporter permease [Bordetella genomosp. 10]
MSTQSVYPPVRVASMGEQTRLFIAAFVIVLIAEFIGNVSIPLGSTEIVLLPLLWAVLIGAVLGLNAKRMPAGVRINSDMQRTAASLLQPVLLLFIAKLGLLVGGAIPKLVASGAGLLFQEFGHFFGTMIFGLPLALLLGIKRQAIGATFSVGREPSLAIIGERFGMKSPEGQGVLAEYLTGTVFGAVFIALLAGLLTSLGIFNPLALAMGAGVGSGSLMAAASGAIAAQQPPEVAKDIAAFAAASNLITTTIGTYFTLFLSLPFTLWAYKVLEPILGRTTKASIDAADIGADIEHELPKSGIGAQIVVWIAVGVFSLFGNWINYKVPATDPAAIAGMAIIVGVVGVGYALYRLTARKLPAVIWVSLIGMILTYPGFPGAHDIAALTGKINFLALSTPILAFAGLSIAKDVPAFRRLGWRIVAVSFAANGGTFIGATIIAQFFMHSPV